MDWAATKSYGESREITCDCGTEFEVRYAKQNGHNDKEEFACPKCGKEYHVMASMSIRPEGIRIIEKK